MPVNGRIFIFMLFLFWLPLSFSAWAAAGGDGSGILVGQIAGVEGGNLLRYVPENNDWVATVKDAPFGLEDALYAEHETKAEFIMPNGTWIRIGGDTQIQMIALDPETATVDVASGLARMYNKNPNAIIKATTPFGYVTAPADAVFDLYVGDQSLEVIAVRGTVDFVHEATGTRYQVRERDASLIADSSGVSRGNGTVDAAWDDWNGQRDSLWARRLSSQGQSAAYLPEPIRDESYALEENGQWENVYYDGGYYPMWRPTSVNPAWSPFTEGRWTVYYGDNCWIPAEPFGYVTHHYGSWVWVEPFRRWYWRPPVARLAAASPGLFIAFGWYPGRVGWIHSGSSIGWVPLAPNERYYAHRPWGRHAVLIKRGQAVNINIGQYRYLDRAVIIPPDYLYRGSRYTPYVQRLGRTAIMNGYKPAPVVDRTVFRAYDSDARRFAFNDAKVERKPHATVLNRIGDNRQLASKAGATSRQQIQRNLGQTRLAALPAAATAISAPVVSSRLVDAAKVNQPAPSLSFPKREMKPQERQRQPNITPAQMSGQRPQTRPAAGGQAIQGNGTASPALGTSGPAVRPVLNQRPASRDQETSAQGSRAPLGQDNQRPIISPRERIPQERTGPSWQPGQQPRTPEASQQQEMQRRQQQEQQRLQQQEAQQRQQAEAQRQQQEMQRRQQQEQQQRLQQQEAQQRQQAEAQRQQQEMQRRQQQEQQQRLQQQEAQRRQQAEAQRQQQEMQRRQQEQQQRMQQQEQRRQQAEAQRQQQETKRRQETQQQDQQDESQKRRGWK